jgi:acetyltransferase-like isoleucine patch superfamily enzyme
MLKVYILGTGTRIHPFKDPAGASWIAGRPLSELQASEIEKAGLEPAFAASPAALPANGPFLLLADYAYASAECLKTFAALCDRTGLGRCCIPKSPATEYPGPLSATADLALADGTPAAGYDLFYVGGAMAGPPADSAGLIAALASASEPVAVRRPFQVRRLRHPNVGPKPYFTELPVSFCIAAHVRSWVNILLLNQVLCQTAAPLALEKKPAPAERLRRGVVSANVRGCIRDSVVGKSLDMHPTAVIENSVVGSGVRVGARAFIKDCIVGDDVVVGDCTKFIGCVVGDRCNSLSDSFFTGCTFYPDSTLSNVNMRQCVIGRHVFLTTAVICFTESLEGPVSVLHEGRLQSTGRHILGSCMGHESMLGTRAIFMPGLALPGGVMIVMPPGEGIHKIPPVSDPGSPLVWDNGMLRKVEEVFPGYVPAEIGSKT